MGVKIKWLGQSGLLFDTGRLRVCIDAYLTDHVYETFGQPGLKRMRPAPIAPENLNADFYCISHDHTDHYDPKSVAAAAAAKSAPRSGLSPWRGLLCAGLLMVALLRPAALPAQNSDAPNLDEVSLDVLPSEGSRA